MLLDHRELCFELIHGGWLLTALREWRMGQSEWQALEEPAREPPQMESLGSQQPVGRRQAQVARKEPLLRRVHSEDQPGEHRRGAEREDLPVQLLRLALLPLPRPLWLPPP